MASTFVSDTTIDVVKLEKTSNNPSRTDAKFRQALKRSCDAMIFIDPARDKIVEASRKACELLGYRRNELSNCNLGKLYPLELSPLHEFIGSVVTHGFGWTEKLSCTCSDGKVIPVEITAFCVNMGGARHVVELVRSVSDHKARETQLQQTSSNQELPVLDEKQRREQDKCNIENALRRAHGRIAGPDGAAELLGIKPSTLRSRIKVYGAQVKFPVLAEHVVTG